MIVSIVSLQILCVAYKHLGYSSLHKDMIVLMMAGVSHKV